MNEIIEALQQALTDEEIKEAIARLTEKGLSLSSPLDANGNTAMHYIINNVSVGYLETLLSELKNVDLVNKEGETLLMSAASAANQLAVYALMNKGANSLRRDKYGVHARSYARSAPNAVKFEKKNLAPIIAIKEAIDHVPFSMSFDDILTQMQANGIKLNDPLDNIGNTAIHLLIEENKIDAIWLQKLNVNKDIINSKNCLGETPLMLAAMKADQPKINYLIMAGADTSIRNVVDKTVGTLVIERDLGFLCFYKPLIAQYYHLQHFSSADFYVHEECSKVINDYLKKYTLTDLVCMDENTLLHQVATYGSAYMLQDLLSRYPNTNVNVQNKFGETPLWGAAINEQEVVNVLLRAGADLSIKDGGDTSAAECLRKNNKKAKITRSSTIPTVGEELEVLGQKALDNAKKSKIAKADIPQVIFNVMLSYVKDKGWLYHPNNRSRSGVFILDYPAGAPHQVNCYDLARGLMGLLHKLGFEDAKIHQYHNLYGKPKNMQGRCFDDDYQQSTFAKSDTYEFDTHCVVMLDGKYYDPTLMLSYNNVNDICATEQVDKKSESKPAYLPSMTQKKAVDRRGLAAIEAPAAKKPRSR